MRYLSVCSGIEAATAAWAPLGWQAAGFAEIEKFPSKVLAHHYGSNMPGEELSRNGVPNHGDFTTIDVSKLGQVDLLVGGTPCQAFSVAGKRLSLADARGNLSLAYAVLMHELARSNGLSGAVWENVPGVLNTKDNAFGCLLGALVGHDRAIDAPRGGKWNDAGMVAGPWARAAWIVRDAQYFGLAQRRRRVFVVVSVGDRIDPAAVLFERQGLRRHPPTRGEAGQDLAGTIDASAARSRGAGINPSAIVANPLGAKADGGWRGHLDHDTYVETLAFGGNDTRGPIDVSAALNAHGGPCGRQDFESETFVVAPPLTSNPYGDHESREGLLIAHSLRGEGFDASEDGTGSGTPIVPVCFDPRQTDVLVHGDMTGPLDTKFPGPAIAFDTTQITSKENRSNPKAGDPCHPLAAAAHPPAIAFQGRGSNIDLGQDVTGTTGSNADRASGGAPCVAFGISADCFDRSGEGAAGTAGERSGLGITEELSQSLKAKRPNAVATAWAVRRLTPRECHRLQGFPDDFCQIPGAADGPIYKALGNSMAVPCMSWIGRRIAEQMRASA